MSKAEAIVWLAEARLNRAAAIHAWNDSGTEIKRLKAVLEAEQAKNANLREAYYVAWGAAQDAKAAFDKTCRA